MKKIFTLSTILVLAVILLAGCTKNGYYNSNDRDYWLSKEYGVVAYSDDYCPYYVIETYHGYTIVYASSYYKPFEGDEIYGDLSYKGYKTFYDYTDDSFLKGEVIEYWLSYADAQYMIDNLCYSGTYGKGVEKKTIKQGLLKK
jgi:hypothetical protein